MFDRPITPRFVQRNRNRGLNKYTYEFEHIYKFFLTGTGGINRRKIIIQIFEYQFDCFVVAFYSPLSCKQRDQGSNALAPYRYLTGLGNAHRVATSVLSAIANIRQKFPDMSFAFQSATLPNEESDRDNRRFKAYSVIMNAVTNGEDSDWTTLEFEENSIIFVIQKKHLPQSDLILQRYGRIFEKVFELEACSQGASN